MEMQSLVKVKVLTLDFNAEPIEVTVASMNGYVSGEQVFNKVCDNLGLKESSRAHFSLFERRNQPLCRYRHKEDIPATSSELYLGKWCFVVSQEKDMIHVDPVAAHLVFLQAQHDLQSGKFDMSEEEKQQLEDCLEPGFTAEEQYILLCQKQTSYLFLFLPHCTLLKHLVTPAGAGFLDQFKRILCSEDGLSSWSRNCTLLQANCTVNVSLSKYGIRLDADQSSVTFTWFQVSRWRQDKKDSTLTLTWKPAEGCELTDVPLHTAQVELLQSGIVEMITLLQKTDCPESSFHAEMISLGGDGSTVWENSLYNPAKASVVVFSV